MVLILSENDVSNLLSMTDGVALMEQAFREYVEGQVVLPPRIHQDLPGSGGALRVVSAALPAMDSFGLKTLTGYPGRRNPGETYFVILLFEMTTGALRAILPANYLTGVRTGAATGAAVKYLAREDAQIHGVLGAGAQAKYQVQAVATVRKIELVKVFAPDYRKAGAFANSISAELEIDAQAVSTAEEAVRGCDIVTAITTAREAVVRGVWLDAGTHLTSAGANTRAKMEIDAVCFSRSKIVTDCQPLAMEEAGDLYAALKNGIISSEQLYAELGEVINGTKRGRIDDQEITLFKSIGVGFQDIAVATHVYKRAVETGTGVMTDLEGTSIGNITPFSIG